MTVVIDPRFRGPATSGNGGYTAGLLAAVLIGTSETDVPEPAVRVRLRRPPPLGTPLEVGHGDDGATLADAGGPVATATWAALEHPVPEPVADETALAAAASYVDAAHHPFPECFVCGPARAPRDGLRLTPGQHQPGRTACVWTPDPTLDDGTGRAPQELVWAALDCPGGWTADLIGRPMVLGTMTAMVTRLPQIGAPYVITGRRDRTDDRRAWTSTAMFDATGALVARAEAVWLQVDAAAFNRILGKG